MRDFLERCQGEMGCTKPRGRRLLHSSCDCQHGRDEQEGESSVVEHWKQLFKFSNHEVFSPHADPSNIEHNNHSSSCGRPALLLTSPMRHKHLESALSSVQREFPDPNVRASRATAEGLEDHPTHMSAAIHQHIIRLPSSNTQRVPPLPPRSRYWPWNATLVRVAPSWIWVVERACWRLRRLFWRAITCLVWTAMLRPSRLRSRMRRRWS